MKYLSIIYSSVLFTLSYFFVDQLGFLIIPAFIILFITLKNLNNYKVAIYSGLLWAAVGYSLQLIWLLELLLNKSQASLYNTIFIYLFIILYLTLLTVIIFCFIYFLFLKTKNLFFKILIFISSFYLYFYFIINKLLFFIDNNWGYPFINPLILLCRYKSFLFLLNLINFNFYNINQDVSKNFLERNKIIYLKPVIKTFNNGYNENTAALMIYQQLSALDLYKISKNYDKLIIVTPESYFPYALNEYEKTLHLWENVLPKNSVLFLTAQRSQKKSSIKNKYYQTIYKVESGRIIYFYDKKHSFWFVEKVPKNFNKIEWTKKLFLADRFNFSKGKDNCKIFQINNQVNFIPMICSEFFFKKDIKTGSRLGGRDDTGSTIYSKFFFDKDIYCHSGLAVPDEALREVWDPESSPLNILLLVVNDSWFLNYFKKLLFYYAILISNMKNIPILYVGHENFSFIKPSNLNLE
ncbi:hypothetical protein KJ644_01325 [Candidatus Dependentiae bacterium]|nr:hypothetical protein [Candidatus Dependentiae bacterium]MBU4387092.1 hypothetical protein [Candidatus Dependentiae bacterium]MCG2756243.1 hypothetical protein [Candidatus Dependentiae bacterium]